MPRRNPPAKWVLPTVVHPDTNRCFVVQIPDDDFYVAAFRGAMENYASAYKWADDAGHTAKQVQGVLRELVDGITECPMNVQAIRISPIDGCEIQVTYDGTTWINAADLSACAEAAASAAVSANNTTINNSGQGGGGVGKAPPIDVTPSEDLRCAVATECAKFVQQQFQASITLWKAAFEAGKAASDFVSDLVAEIPLFGGIIKATTDFIFDVDTGHFDDLLAFNSDVDQYQNWLFCKLFCRLGTDGVLTQDIFDGWKHDLELEPPQGALLTLIGQVQGLCIASIGINRLQAEAFIHEHDSGTACDPCADCPSTWTHVFDFTTGEHGWQIDPTYNLGVWTSGVGYESNSGGSGYQQIYVNRATWPSGASIDALRAIGTCDADRTDGHKILIVVENGVTFHEFNGTTAGAFDATQSVTGLNLNNCFLAVVNNNGGAEVLTSITLSGSGSDPF